MTCKRKGGIFVLFFVNGYGDTKKEEQQTESEDYSEAQPGNDCSLRIAVLALFLLRCFASSKRFTWANTANGAVQQE